ncbi:hypothetical protein FHS04_001103 [Mesoflavibacter sabulilitoris]|uniref:Uncharacterized protein n=1 Tax=Mesoflavibacter zeaxanthinifaciens subsp. sabulilitoris TaxID=1520893 RepID=A0A2T1NAU4_9FLAO|nr:hypothetical protein [Mesoflavibacter zeaxanthinifaciens]MBB3123600.1 hypothetical protein [Mesoflavibacter zeaxanthinifaciens subsp. sabulilitoris]PSG89271.1 hypothetical protein C7H61_09980 [Mesoflavibacter zeaxanthinifaciens subsp. sabulilitoris]
MKKLICFILLFSTVAYSQNEEQLIEDNCNCVKTIEKNISIDQKKKSIMSCSLNAFKKNRSYTEKVVKKFTGKNSIDGNDVFNYLQNVFDYTMTNECTEYRNLMAEILGANSLNSTVKEIGIQVCSELKQEYSKEKINSIIEKINIENKEKIMKEYSVDFKENYKNELNLFLFYNCEVYRHKIKQTP